MAYANRHADECVVIDAPENITVLSSRATMLDQLQREIRLAAPHHSSHIRLVGR